MAKTAHEYGAFGLCGLGLDFESDETGKQNEDDPFSRFSRIETLEDGSMSAFYLGGIIAVWVMLTGLLWGLWYVVEKKAGEKWNHITTPVFVLIILAWLATSLWYGGGRKYYYDAKVNRLCEIDGGIKVYETVMLPPEKFNEWGHVKKDTLEPEYIFKRERIYLWNGKLNLSRVHTEVVRRDDGKMLGETTLYSRSGGDFPGPWSGSGYYCPSIDEAGDGTLLNRIFINSALLDPVLFKQAFINPIK